MVSQWALPRTLWGSYLRGILLLAIAAGLAGCGGKKRIQIPPPTPVPVGWKQKGIASWYGHPYHGRRTSNGDVYDMNKFTAAHLTLPFDTWVRVTNLGNRRSVDVRINDRGPFVKKRIIDLSRAAAQRIHMLGPGTARVRLEVVATSSARYWRKKQRKPRVIRVSTRSSPNHALGGHDREEPCAIEPSYGVQVGAFQVAENARGLRDKMARQYGYAQIVTMPSTQAALYRVVAGYYSNVSSANDLRKRLRNDGIDGFVTAFEKPDEVDCL